MVYVFAGKILQHFIGLKTEALIPDTRENSKHHDGTVGKLTLGLVDRTSYYEHAAILALIPFINLELYATEDPSSTREVGP